MADNTLITEIGEWLVDQALSDTDIVEMFELACDKLYGAGVPLARARLAWPTLHPLFQAETVLWQRGEDTTLSQFQHQNERTEEFLVSPMHFMLEHNISVIRRNLDGPNKLVDFAVLEELMEKGMTDYLTIRTMFRQGDEHDKAFGLLVAWASDRPGGFSDDDIAALQKIQRRIAIACRTAIQARVASNIVETYLGKHAGRQVLDGAIKRGDGQETQAVVWYSDLRDSTALGDTMAPEDYFQLLNDYYECTAAAAIKHGGEVLDFIGDAVLAIFPYPTEDEFEQATKAATQALREANTLCKEINAKRTENGGVPIRYGVGLNTGKVMFGNIGVQERLTFSVIGPTVNEVARIESLTKAAGTSALVTEKIADSEPGQWVSTGMHKLVGVSKEIELFAPDQQDQQRAVEMADAPNESDARVLN